MISIYRNVCVCVNTVTNALNPPLLPSFQPSHFQISDNNIESVRKGCWSKNVVFGQTVSANFSSSSGAWGTLQG